jgi:hypothetical protein
MKMAISLLPAPARRPSNVKSASRRFLVRVVQRVSCEDGVRFAERTRRRRWSWLRTSTIEAGTGRVVASGRAVRSTPSIVSWMEARMKPKLHYELQQHGHDDNVDAGRCHALQHRDHDRDHGRGDRSGAGKAEVDDDQEQAEHGEDDERGSNPSGRTDW